MTKKQVKAMERQNALAVLRAMLRPGDTVSTILRHVSASGMQREISLTIARLDSSGSPSTYDITYRAAEAMGERIGKRGGIVAGGCGMDMGFSLVYSLGHALWPNGTPEPHGTRNGEPDTCGGYALKHRWL